MSTVAATNLKNLIADVTAFRTWVGAADQTEARARVYVAGVDAEDATRPFALVTTDEAPANRRVAGGAADVHEEEGAIQMLFEDDATGTLEAAAKTFLVAVGGILSGIRALAGNGYLRIRSIEAAGVRRADIDEDDDYMQALFRVEWGTA
jgi:hypothetical protein